MHDAHRRSPEEAARRVPCELVVGQLSSSSTWSQTRRSYPQSCTAWPRSSPPPRWPRQPRPGSGWPRSPSRRRPSSGTAPGAPPRRGSASATSRWSPPRDSSSPPSGPAASSSSPGSRASPKSPNAPCCRSSPPTSGRSRRAPDTCPPRRTRSSAGDLYDWFHSDQRICFIVGDVRGKGMNAVEQAARVIRAFRQSAAGGADLATAAAEMSAYIAPFLDDEEFVTAALVQVERRAGDAGQLRAPTAVAHRRGRRRPDGGTPTLPSARPGKYLRVRHGALGTGRPTAAVHRRAERGP